MARFAIARATTALAINLAAVASANAMCSQWRSDVDSALNYLVCLHNEQADSLNRHAQAINDLSDSLRTMDQNGLTAARKIDALEDEVRLLQQKIQNLEQEIEAR